MKTEPLKMFSFNIYYCFSLKDMYVLQINYINVNLFSLRISLSVNEPLTWQVFSWGSRSGQMNPQTDRFFLRISLSKNEPLPWQVFPDDLPPCEMNPYPDRFSWGSPSVWMNSYTDRFSLRISLSVNEPLPRQVCPEDLPQCGWTLTQTGFSWGSPSVWMNSYPRQVFPENLPKLVLVRSRMPLGVPQMFRHEVLNATYDVLIRRLWEKQDDRVRTMSKRWRKRTCSWS